MWKAEGSFNSPLKYFLFNFKNLFFFSFPQHNIMLTAHILELSHPSDFAKVSCFYLDPPQSTHSAINLISLINKCDNNQAALFSDRARLLADALDSLSTYWQDWRPQETRRCGYMAGWSALIGSNTLISLHICLGGAQIRTRALMRAKAPGPQISDALVLAQLRSITTFRSPQKNNRESANGLWE